MDRAAALLCLIVFGNTFSIGAFPVLLPEIGRSAGVDDAMLGAIAGAFGLARVFADIPAGLFITHHLRRAIVLGTVSLAVGLLCLASGGPPWLLILGRALFGVGHAFGMLSGITVIVRHARRPGFALNALEMSAMLGVLGGMVCAGFLPADWPWNKTLLVAALPQFLGLLALPALLKAVPLEPHDGSPRPWFSRGHALDDRDSGRSRISRMTLLAFATGAVIALTWAALGQFVLPLRAAREFDLPRTGVSMLLAIPQVVDVILLLPIGALADRRSRARVLGTVLLVLAVGIVAVAFGSLPWVIAGCVLFGVGLAAWMLPVGLINRDSPPSRVAWRTALYRVGVDSGVFLGPVLSGVLAERGMLWLVGSTCAGLLLLLGVGLLYEDRRSAIAASSCERDEATGAKDRH
jgi:MFS family permease